MFIIGETRCRTYGDSLYYLHKCSVNPNLFFFSFLLFIYFLCVLHKHNFLFAMWNKDWGKETQKLETPVKRVLYYKGKK